MKTMGLTNTSFREIIDSHVQSFNKNSILAAIKDNKAAIVAVEQVALI